MPQKCPVNTAANARGGFEAFFSGFVQERNIRWMLVLGATIVLGSSLMLVSREWNYLPAFVKYLTVIGYTLLAAVGAEFSGKRMGLRATSRVLQVLTVFLFPICFLSLNWLSAGTGVQTGVLSSDSLLMLLPVSLMTFVFAGRIFREWLHESPVLFTGCYLILSAVGALPQAASPLLASMIVCGLWAVMSVGVIKVNRQIFWLTEEHRWPRIFGFFPILLLGSIFVAVSTIKTWRVMPLEWSGVVCVMMSATVLLTARTVAAVFRQRTGDLVRPLPWPIMLPLVVGIGLTFTGVVLSFHGFRFTGPSTTAAIPASALAAALMWICASDTKHRAFTWLALILGAITYQNLPVLAPDLVRAIKGDVAMAIHQPRLPLAFYGITYLPYLLANAYLFRVAEGRRWEHIASPVRIFVTLVSIIWCASSLTNAAAAFWVSVFFIAAWTTFAVLMNDRRFVAGSLIAAVSAAISVEKYVESLPGAGNIEGLAVACLSSLALIWILCRPMDTLLLRIPLPKGLLSEFFMSADGRPRRVCEMTGWMTGLGLSIIWSIQTLQQPLAQWAAVQYIEFSNLLAIFAVHTMRRKNYFSGMVFWCLLIIGSSSSLLSQQLPWGQLASWSSGIASAVSLLGYFFVRQMEPDLTWQQIRDRIGFREGRPAFSSIETLEKGGLSRLAEACVVPLVDLCLGVLACLAVFFHLPILVWINFAHSTFELPVSTLLFIAWLIGGTFAWRSRIVAALSASLLPLAVSAIVVVLMQGHPVLQVYPVLWVAGCACSAILASFQNDRTATVQRSVSLIWLMLILVASSLFFELTLRAASILALAVIGSMKLPVRSSVRNAWLLVAGQIQLILLVGSCAGLDGPVPFVLAHGSLLPATSWCLATMSLLVLAKHIRGLVNDDHVEMLGGIDHAVFLSWATVLEFISALVLVLSLLLPVGDLTACILLTFSACVLAANFLIEAVEWQRKGLAYCGFGLLGAVSFWGSVHGMINPSAIGTLWGCLLFAASARILSDVCRRHNRCAVLSDPLSLIASSLPMVVALLAIGGALVDGIQSVDVLRISTGFSCAGLYFLYWLKTRDRTDLILSGITFNLSIVTGSLLMRLTDPQFYLVPMGVLLIGLVQVLRKELPDSMRDACRYIGAFMVLSSPLMGIAGGSWLHVFLLMVLSVLMAFAGIGFRVRSMTYSGTAFLIADILWMIVRSSIDHPAMLWVCGVVFGAAVIGLAAYCESHRERLAGRIRLLTAELGTWN